MAQAVTVLASAIGPLLLAWCVTWTGSYAAMFRLLAAAMALAAVAGLLVSLPAPHPPPVGARVDGTLPA
jgi:cyanate permease